MNRIVLCFFICCISWINPSYAQTFLAHGERFSVSAPKGFCSLSRQDQVENYLLNMAERMSPKFSIPVFFLDCSSLEEIKKGQKDYMSVYGGIKVSHERFYYPLATFIDEMEKKLIDKNKVQERMGKIITKSNEIASGKNVDFSIKEVQYLGSDGRAVYVGGPLMNGQKSLYMVSCFTLNKSIIFNIEFFAERDKLKFEELFNIVKKIKDELSL